jgi:hypothetical protein
MTNARRWTASGDRRRTIRCDEHEKPKTFPDKHSIHRQQAKSKTGKAAAAFPVFAASLGKRAGRD